MKKKLFTFLLLAAMTVQCAAFAGSFSREAEEGNANKISYVNYLKPVGKFEYKKMSGQPAVADTDILGKWTLRSWANARIVCYEFTKDNYWIAYSPQWVGPDPKPKNDENGYRYLLPWAVAHCKGRRTLQRGDSEISMSGN